MWISTNPLSLPRKRASFISASPKIKGLLHCLLATEDLHHLGPPLHLLGQPLQLVGGVKKKKKIA